MSLLNDDIKDCEVHHQAGCYVDQLWNELRGEKVWYLGNDYEGFGISFIKC